MGWTYTHKTDGISVFEFFQERFKYSKDDGSYGKVIACATVNLHTAYMAYEIFSPEKGKEVVALICRLDYVPNDYYNFGFKDMDETCGPNEVECPERILRLLTPTEHEWAKKWREACWQNVKSRVRLTKGKRVRSPQPLHFSNGESYQEFVVVSAKDKTFRTNGNQLVRIKGKVKWQEVTAQPHIPADLQLHQGGMF